MLVGDGGCWGPQMHDARCWAASTPHADLATRHCMPGTAQLNKLGKHTTQDLVLNMLHGHHAVQRHLSVL